MVNVDLTKVKDSDHPDRDEDHPNGDEDLFYKEVPVLDKEGNPILIKDKNGKESNQAGYITTWKMTKKYFKNRHFFIDPFQLTIAQWCYVHEYQKGDSD